MPRKRCPKGTHRNKKTGRCKKTEKSKQTREIKKHSPKQLTQTRKRCPKGTRKNKKTGMCEPTKHTGILPNTMLSNVIDIPSVSNIDELGRVVHKRVETLKKERTVLMNTPSFSPAVNKQLITLNLKTPKEISAYKCEKPEKQSNLYDGMSTEDMKDVLTHDQYFDSLYLGRVSKSINLETCRYRDEPTSTKQNTYKSW